MEEEFTITATITYTVKDMLYDDGGAYDHKCIACDGFFKRRFIGSIAVMKTVGTESWPVEDDTKLCMCNNCYSDIERIAISSRVPYPLSIKENYKNDKRFP